MSNKEGGLDWALGAHAKEKLEERTGYKDAGIITRPDAYLSLQQLKRTLEDKIKVLEAMTNSIDKAVSRAMKKRLEYANEMKTLKKALKETERLDNDFILRESVVFSRTVTNDLSKLSLVAGNKEMDKSRSVDEVLG